MVTISSKIGMVILSLLLLALPLLAACSDDDETAEVTSTETSGLVPTETAEPTESPIPTEKPAEDVVITLGNMSDLTGPAAQALIVVDMALEDIVRYFNDNNLIPGVELKVETYDGQYDPSRNIPGYEWLKERGADVIVGGVPAVGMMLKETVEEDETVLFSLSCELEMIDPPGYVFPLNVTAQSHGITLAKWIAENDWDYQTNGPATIGAAGWNTPYIIGLAEGMEAYATAHPDQFTWEGTYLTNYSFIWDPEIDALKNADYVLVPATGMSTVGFMEQYLAADGKGRFIGTEAHTAYLGMMEEGVGWDGMDDMLIQLPVRWWTEDAELPNLVNSIINEYRSVSDIETIMYGGYNYVGCVSQYYPAFEAIAQTVERVGAENFTSKALYETLNSFSITYDGFEEWNYTDTKRVPQNHVGIYELDAGVQDLVRKDPKWQPVLYTP